MTAEQTDAIVLRTFPWSESSLVVHLYTRDFGKRSVLAKGARRPKSPFEAALDLLSCSRVVFISKSGDALDILTEAKLEQRFRAGTRDLLRLYCGYYVAELLDKLTERGEQQPEVFDLALATLQALAQPGLEVRAIVLRFELQMLRCLGQMLSLRQCAQCGQLVADVLSLQTEFGRNETSSIENQPLATTWFMIGLLAGGILCSSCQPGSAQMVRISAEGRSALERFSSPGWRDIDLTDYPIRHRSAIRGLMVRYLMVVLDRKLQLHSYIEELGH